MRKDKENIVNTLSLEEKSELLVQGLIEQWDEPKYGMTNFSVSDGASGVRRDRYAERKGEEGRPVVCFPSPSLYACSWNRELVREIGKSLGKQAKSRGVDVLFSPGCNIKRSPLCGRNFEYYSEDPVLTGELASEFIMGVKETGTGACAKHFAANNQETKRMSVDERIGKRALREIYLKAFEKPVREGKPDMVMTAYNRVNGEYCADSRFLLKEVLREEWGYKGSVITDCVGAHDLAKALKNGLTLQLSSESKESIFREVSDLIARGKLTEEDVDRAVRNTLELGEKYRNRGRRGSDSGTEQAYLLQEEERHCFAQTAAEESMVLLKNEKSLLPLDRKSRIGVIGGFAKDLRYQGGGSNYLANPYRVEQLFDAVKEFCPDAVWSQGYDGEKSDSTWEKEALETAGACEKIIFCMGLPQEYESEGYDRSDMDLPPCQEALLKKLAEVNENIIVVLFHGAPVTMAWTEYAGAVLDAGLPGEAGGTAAARCLFGEVNPSGKLAESYPLKLSDTPCYLNFPGEMDRVEYSEGIYVGYRYYDKKEMGVAFPFGYGLSYTSFSYSEIQVKQTEKEVEVSFRIENTGSCDGKETVQLYIAKPGKYYSCPVRELQDFKKVSLKAGEKKTVTFTVPEKAFRVYDEEAECWVMEGGIYRVDVGTSSREINLSEEVELQADTELLPVTRFTVLKDIFERYGKRDVMNALFREYGLNENNLTVCDSRDITARSMGCMNTLDSLKRSDPALTEEILEKILYGLNKS